MKLYVYPGGSGCDRAVELLARTGLQYETVTIRGVGDMQRAGIVRTPTLMLESCDEMIAFAAELALHIQKEDADERQG